MVAETVLPVPKKLACVTEKLPTKPSSELAPAPSLTEPVFFLSQQLLNQLGQ
jgi:hypothetical protein